MRAGYDLQAAVLDAGVPEREPHRQHLRLVGLRQHHPVVLVPVRGSHLERAGHRVTRASRRLRSLDAHVLHRVRVDLGPDEASDEIEQIGTPEHLEHRRPVPHRRVVSNAGLRQREVEVLGVGLVGLGADLDESLAERQVVVQAA